MYANSIDHLTHVYPVMQLHKQVTFKLVNRVHLSDHDTVLLDFNTEGTISNNSSQ